MVMFCKTAYDSLDPDYGSGSEIGGIGLVFILGMGVILLGVVLMLIMAKVRPEFFAGKVIRTGTDATHNLEVLEADGTVVVK